MAVSHFIENYLSVAHVHYQVVPHRLTESSYDSACSAHLPASRVVKAVMLRDRAGRRFAMALIPASNRLNLAWLPGSFGGLQLAREEDLDDLFPDCALGAIPGFGQAFDLDLIWDEELLERDTLYFEGGDHRALVRIDQFDFRDLFCRYPHAVISAPCHTARSLHANASRGVH